MPRKPGLGSNILQLPGGRTSGYNRFASGNTNIQPPCVHQAIQVYLMTTHCNHLEKLWYKNAFVQVWWNFLKFYLFFVKFVILCGFW